MKSLIRFGRLVAIGLVACLALSGCITAKFYVPNDLPTLTRADLPPPAQPKPVQVLFEFRNKGNANATATTKVRPAIMAVATNSGLFSNVSQTPVGGGMLTVTIDNVPLSNDAASKGMATGLTLGLAGSMVADGYTCTATYTSNGKVTTAEVKHSIYTTIGNHDGPPGLAPMEADGAVNLAMSQIMWHLLKQLSDKHAFD
ncbi:MAG TPA: hypothetical protein VGH80_03580 [Xanthomonadaceae bacterium]|jgi:hypothetical protein